MERDTELSEEEQRVQRVRMLTDVMRDTLWMFKPEDDIAKYERILKVVGDKEVARVNVVGKMQEDLDVLAARHAEAARKAQRPEGTPTAEEHEYTVRDLQDDQYRTGKSLNEEQAGVTRREAELGRARTEREEVRAWDVASEGGKAPKVLRLNIFRGLGFRPLEPLDDGKMLVRNDLQSDVHVVELSADRVQTASRMWELAT